MKYALNDFVWYGEDSRDACHIHPLIFLEWKRMWDGAKQKVLTADAMINKLSFGVRDSVYGEEVATMMVM